MSNEVTSGIGFAIAEILLRRGASVTLLARDRRRLEESALDLARRCDCLRRRAGAGDDHHRDRDELDEGRIGWISVDVVDYARVRRAVETSEVRRGCVDAGSLLALTLAVWGSASVHCGHDR